MSERIESRALLMRWHFAPVILPLLLCACSEPAESIADGEQELVGSGRKGVDYAWDRPSPQTLRSLGYTYASRYLSWDKTGKNLTAAEARSLIAAGMDIVSNWEYDPRDALSGYSAGAANAREAQRQAAAAGMPPDRPIYFSVDFDASSSQQSQINAYFDGIASVMVRSRIGAYGGYGPIKRLFDAGKIHWGWQTFAWSGGQWDPRAQLRQTQTGVQIAGADCDIDQARANDFGQWGTPASAANGRDKSSSAASNAGVTNSIDRNLQVFAMNSSGTLRHTAFDFAGGTGWVHETLPASLGSSPATTTSSDGNLQIFARGSDGRLRHWAYDLGTHTGFVANEDLGGNITGIPAVSTSIDGNLQVLARGADGTLRHWAFGFASGTGWVYNENLGGPSIIGSPSVTTSIDGNLQVFATNADGSLRHTSFDFVGGRGWQTESLSASILGSPTATNSSDGNLQVFAQSQDHRLLHWAYGFADGTAWHAEVLDGTYDGSPAATSSVDGNLQVFIRGQNGDLRHIAYGFASNTGWFYESLGGSISGVPSTTTSTDGNLQVFARGSDATLRHWAFGFASGTGWVYNENLNGSIQ